MGGDETRLLGHAWYADVTGRVKEKNSKGSRLLSRNQVFQWPLRSSEVFCSMLSLFLGSFWSDEQHLLPG